MRQLPWIHASARIATAGQPDQLVCHVDKAEQHMVVFCQGVPYKVWYGAVCVCACDGNGSNMASLRLSKELRLSLSIIFSILYISCIQHAVVLTSLIIIPPLPSFDAIKIGASGLGRRGGGCLSRAQPISDRSRIGRHSGPRQRHCSCRRSPTSSTSGSPHLWRESSVGGSEGAIGVYRGGRSHLGGDRRSPLGASD